MQNFDIEPNINCKLYISLVAESRSPYLPKKEE